MKNKHEVWGLRIEILGLLILLAGSFWQANFSGWWDKASLEWQNYIQEEVNLATLSSLRHIAAMQATEDLELKESISKQTSDQINDAFEFALSERNKRKRALDTGQAALFSDIEKYLVLLGAIILIIGKFVTSSGATQPLAQREINRQSAWYKRKSYN